MFNCLGHTLRQELKQEDVVPFIGVYDVFSASADAVLVDALRDLSLVRRLREKVDKPLVFNQIAGGKSPPCSLRELRDVGVSIVIYSTPCLFAAQGAIENAMKAIRENNGLLLSTERGGVDVKSCTALLNENLGKRDKR